MAYHYYGELFFPANYWHDEYWPSFGDSIIYVPGSVPGIDYTFSYNLIEYTFDKTILDYTYKSDIFDYTNSQDISEYTSTQLNVDYTE